MPGARHSTWMPASLISLPMRPMSDFIFAENSSGVLPTASPPELKSRSFKEIGKDANRQAICAGELWRLIAFKPLATILRQGKLNFSQTRIERFPWIAD